MERDSLLDDELLFAKPLSDKALQAIRAARVGAIILLVITGIQLLRNFSGQYSYISNTLFHSMDTVFPFIYIPTLLMGNALNIIVMVFLGNFAAAAAAVWKSDGEPHTVEILLARFRNYLAASCLLTLLWFGFSLINRLLNFLSII